jgi:3-oxoadipate enol-lactonase
MTLFDIEENKSWIDLSGVRLHYRLDGSEDSPVLVLSSSLGANLTMWDAEITEFAKHFRILRYDPRGHGESSTPLGPYRIEDLSGDVLELLDALGIEACYFCGLSMGGMVGQWLGINAPHRIRKLVLCNTASKIGTAEIWNARIAGVLSDGVGAISAQVLERWFTPEFHRLHPEEIAKSRKMLETTDRFGYAACCAALRETDLTESMQRINAATLVISGAHDPVTTPADGKQLAESISKAIYVELDAAHISNIEAADEFTSAVLRFLQS